MWGTISVHLILCILTYLAVMFLPVSYATENSGVAARHSNPDNSFVRHTGVNNRAEYFFLDAQITSQGANKFGKQIQI